MSVQVRAVGISWAQMLQRVSALVGALPPAPQNSAHGRREPQISAEEREQVLATLASYAAASEDFKEFVQYRPESYTKNLVAEIVASGAPGAKPALAANIIVMCWAPGQASAVHAHEGSRCFVKVLQGELQEERLAHPSYALVDKCKQSPTTRTSIMRANEVTYIDDSIGCHRVTNRSGREPAVTLHVYSPAYLKCRVFEDGDSLGAKPERPPAGPLSLERSRAIDVTFTSSQAAATAAAAAN